jgi:hypothetical protein
MKLIAVLFLLAFSVSVMACGGDKTSSTDSGPSSEETSTEQG